MSFTVGTEAYARHVGPYGAALSAAHADAAHVVRRRSTRRRCGPGALLAELARRLGTERVGGVDPSEAFVAAARAAAVPGVDVRAASAERLPFDTDAFDVVLSQLVVNFKADADAGVGEMRRVARRAVTSCVWDYAGEMTMLRAFWDAALELDPDAPDEGRTMRYCTPEELNALWTRAGLSDVETQPLVVKQSPQFPRPTMPRPPLCCAHLA